MTPSGVIHALGIGPLAWPLSIGTAFSLVYFPFRQLDKVQSRRNRAFVSNWIKGTRPESAIGGWTTFYSELFVAAFGKKHLSIKCAFRSSIMTVVMVVFMTSMWRGAIQGSVLYVLEILISASIVNIPADYCVLFKSRLILTHFDAVTSKVGVAGLILIDASLSFVIFFFAVQMGHVLITFLLWWEAGFPAAATVWDFFIPAPNVAMTALGLWRFDFPLFHLLFVSSFLTSAWVWIYMVVALGLRAWSLTVQVLRSISPVIDMDTHPVRSIGFVAGCISSTIAATVGLLFHLGS